MPIPIDLLGREILSSQIESSERLGPFGAWFFLATVLIDAVGNILGVPIFSGLLLNAQGWAGKGLADLRWVCRGVILIQVAMLVQGAIFLHRSAWRFWLPIIAREMPRSWSMGRKNLLAAAFGLVAAIGLLIAISWIRASAEPSLRQALVVVPFLVGLLAFMLYGLRYAVALVPRLDGPSAAGLGFSLASAFLCFTLFCVADDNVASFSTLIWSRDDLVTFRIVELTCAGSVFGFIAVLACGRDAAARYYRVEAPTPASVEVFYDWAFLKNAVRPAWVTLDLEQLPQVVVFRQRADDAFELVDSRQRLVPTEDRCIVVNLDALQARLGQSLASLADQGGFFIGEAEIVVQPCPVEVLDDAERSILAAGISERETTLFLKRFLGNRNLRAFVDQACGEAIRRYSSSLQGTAQEFHERYLAMFRESRALVGEGLSRSARNGSGGGLSIEGPPLTYIGGEALLQGHRLIEEKFVEIHEAWAAVRRKVLDAPRELPRQFCIAVRDQLLGELSTSRRQRGAESSQPTPVAVDDSSLDGLLECVGLTLIVRRFEFAPGASTDCERMALIVDASQSAAIKALEERLSRLDEKRTDSQTAQSVAILNRFMDLLPRIANRPQLISALLESFKADASGIESRDFLSQLEQAEHNQTGGNAALDTPSRSSVEF